VCTPSICNTHCRRCCAAAVSLQVSHEHLGGRSKQVKGPTWQQLWQLLQALTAKQQQQGAAGQTAGQTNAMDATALFDQYLREAEAVPLTPPPYPGGLAFLVVSWGSGILLTGHTQCR
jgi:hypothetical protein